MSTTPDPIDQNTQRVLVRNTASGFEQGIAAVAGLFTAGPLGMLCSWGAIRGLQGKWAPWFILGIPSAIVLIIIQVALLGILVEATNDENDNQSFNTRNEPISLPLRTSRELFNQININIKSA